MISNTLAYAVCPSYVGQVRNLYVKWSFRLPDPEDVFQPFECSSVYSMLHGIESANAPLFLP